MRTDSYRSDKDRVGDYQSTYRPRRDSYRSDRRDWSRGRTLSRDDRSQDSNRRHYSRSASRDNRRYQDYASTERGTSRSRHVSSASDYQGNRDRSSDYRRQNRRDDRNRSYDSNKRNTTRSFDQNRSTQSSNHQRGRFSSRTNSVSYDDMCDHHIQTLEMMSPPTDMNLSLIHI